MAGSIAKRRLAFGVRKFADNFKAVRVCIGSNRRPAPSQEWPNGSMTSFPSIKSCRRVDKFSNICRDG